jgi:hypothetical protein
MNKDNQTRQAMRIKRDRGYSNTFILYDTLSGNSVFYEWYKNRNMLKEIIIEICEN